MREVIGVLKGYWISSCIRYDVGIPYDAQRTVHAPFPWQEPSGACRQSLERFSLVAEALQILEIPDHANPAGLDGAVFRSGKVNELAAAVAGFRRLDACSALIARAILSFFEASSSTSVG